MKEKDQKVIFKKNWFEEAFGDIRQKLVEEGWFGRAVTANPAREYRYWKDVSKPEAEIVTAEALGWGLPEPSVRVVGFSDPSTTPSLEATFRELETRRLEGPEDHSGPEPGIDH